MKRHLTEHLAALAPRPLGEAIAAGEGFEVIVAGSAARWDQTAPPREDAGAVIWELAQRGGSLRARSLLRADAGLRAAAHEIELTNAGGSPVVIDGLYLLVVRFPHLAGPWRTLTARGGTSENFYPPRAFGTAERVVFGGEVRIESHPDGRSSNLHLPLMLAAAGPEEDAPGLFAGLEHSGEWFLSLRHVGDGPFLRGRVKIDRLVLKPGETLALPAAHVGFFDGGLEGGTNATPSSQSLTKIDELKSDTYKWNITCNGC